MMNILYYGSSLAWYFLERELMPTMLSLLYSWHTCPWNDKFSVRLCHEPMFRVHAHPQWFVIRNQMLGISCLRLTSMLRWSSLLKRNKCFAFLSEFHKGRFLVYFFSGIKILQIVWEELLKSGAGSLHPNNAMTVQFSNLSSALEFTACAEAEPSGQTHSGCKKMIYVL